ncbi:YceI family protein [Winogradskyella sediminis]|uniref:Polyisoprenoid-binding protein YceI n=1 Tax=Winogradskyella sediminis TaxID=1382466 RepID=A0A1H1NQK9_9FLAO|nr:YceI family protein [Winogradskyella sediminis]REG87193.1 polyisoprenoid-binding protein YceI [Winogradskyella sediminis]SDS01296.1 Polyisoprenoid-binding protein YceI [Winogradskyella sediminis]
MKSNFFKFFTLIAFITFSSCGDKAKEANTTETKDAAVAKSSSTSYNVNTEKSTIEWQGSKPTGTHNGIISLSAGKLNTSDGSIVGGKFIIDMSSIVVQDIPAEEEGNQKLTTHLKSDDFFDVESFPNAIFEVTDAKDVEGKLMLSGNLTIKDKTNNISIPVKLSSTDDSTITLTSEKFTIDRSKWHVKYGSKSFFEDLGDKFISNDIELKINVVANKI